MTRAMVLKDEHPAGSAVRAKLCPMRKIAIGTALLAFCSILLAAANPAVGVWKVISTGPNAGEEFVWKMTIKEADGKLTGTLAGEMGEFAISDLKVDANVLTGKVTIDPEAYAVELKLDGNKGEGKWKGGGGEGGTLKATKE